MIPVGIYSITQSVLILVGAFLAFTGRDKRIWWPAGAMILSLASARLATGAPDFTVLVLLIATPICALLAAEGKTPASRVIAATYIPRLLCYGGYALGLLPLWAMWEFSNFFLNIQIVALWVGAIGGGNLAWIGLGLGGRNDPGDTAAAGVLEAAWGASERSPGGDLERPAVDNAKSDATG